MFFSEKAYINCNAATLQRLQHSSYFICWRDKEDSNLLVIEVLIISFRSFFEFFRKNVFSFEKNGYICSQFYS